MPRRPAPPVAATGARLLDLAVDALATYRLTRLITTDVIAEPVRRTVLARTMGETEVPPGATALEVVEDTIDPPGLARLVTCRWCTGVWVAAGVVGARTLAPRLWPPVAEGLALSSAAVLLARAEDG